VNSSFSKITPFLQIAWDNTSIDTYKQCPRKYYLSIILGKANSEQNVHLEFGILYHEGLEFFHRCRSEGVDFDSAQQKMVRRILERTWLNGKPWFTGDSYKNRYTLLRSLVWHTEQYRDDAFEQIFLAGKPAIELSFSYSTPAKTKDGENILLCGHIDRLVSTGGVPFGTDYKTTKYNISGSDFFQFFSPDNQVSMYTLAGKVIYKTEIQGIIIDAAQVQVGGTRFARAPISRTQSQIDEWYGELMDHWIPLALESAYKQQWPMNDTACGRYGGCQFRGICGKAPEVRDQWLRASFKDRSWDPLRTRGDV
jgi:hypothetical protein